MIYIIVIETLFLYNNIHCISNVLNSYHKFNKNKPNNILMQTKHNKISIIFIIGVNIILFLLVFVFVKTPIFADENNKLEIYFFYSEDCKDCISVMDNINNLMDKKYSNIKLKTYEISKNNENLNILFYILDKLDYNNSEDVSVPVIFIGNSILIGKDQIDKDFENILKENIDKGKYSNIVSNIIKEYSESAKVEEFSQKEYITIPAVIISAFLDSINPCAIAVIIFLISTLIINTDKRKILIFGLIYIITIFVVYLSLGLGLVYLIKKINIPHLFFIIVGGILIIIGLLNFKDFFAYGRGPSLRIPETIKNFITKNIYKATVFSIILAGLVVSIFESVCSGVIYLGILSLISQFGLNLRYFLLLIIYNFIFILPLLVILIIFYFGFPLKKINRLMIQKRKKVYKLIVAIILISLGIYLIVLFLAQ